jgi:hypothetical protein
MTTRTTAVLVHQSERDGRWRISCTTCRDVGGFAITRNVSFGSEASADAFADKHRDVHDMQGVAA